MKVEIVENQNGEQLRYAYSQSGEVKPWILLILPFGLDVTISKAFFESFEDKYNILTWEFRSKLYPQSEMVSQQRLSMQSHMADMEMLLSKHQITEAILIGYCSGAGIAMAVADKHGDMFKTLILVHGDYLMLDDPSCLTQVAVDLDGVLPIAAESQDNADFIFDNLSKTDKGYVAELPDYIDIELAFSKRHYFYRHALNYMSYKSLDITAIAKRLGQQTLVMTGNKDNNTNVNSAKKIEKLIGNVSLYCDPDADHYGILRPNSNTLQQIHSYLE